jgi:DNA (cytosine-5)-methyltransferase 1
MWIIPKSAALNGALARVETISDLNEFCRACASSLHVRSKPTRWQTFSRKWKRDSWMQPPVWTDCRTFPCELFTDRVALFIASYPCQPFSVAGKKRGHADERNLWPAVRNGVRTMRPVRCFFENVENHVSLGLSTVLSDLAEDGYHCAWGAWGIFSAEECGAPHRRKRVFIMADAVRIHGSGWHGALRGRRRVREDGEELAEPVCWRSASAHASVRQSRQIETESEPLRISDGLADAEQRQFPQPERGSQRRNGSGSAGAAVADAGCANGNGRRANTPEEHRSRPSGCFGGTGGELANADGTGFGEHGGTVAVRPEHAAAQRGLPHFPPRPDQLDEWREVLAIDPSVEPTAALAYLTLDPASRLGESEFTELEFVRR